MANLVNPVSFRLSYNCYWNNVWALNSLINYSYINMLDYCFLKCLNFMWFKMKWYRRGLVIYNFKLFRVFNEVKLTFAYKNQKLYDSFLEVIRLRKAGPVKKRHWNDYSIKNFIIKKKRDPALDIVRKNNVLFWLKVIKKNASLWKHPFIRKKVDIYFKRFIKRISVFLYKAYVSSPQWGWSFGRWFRRQVLSYRKKLFGERYVKRVCLRYGKRRVNVYSYIGKYIIAKVLSSYFFSFFKIIIFKFAQKVFNSFTISINVILTASPFVSAFFISRFMCVKLLKGFPFRKVMRMVLWKLRFLLRKKYIKGFKILMSGRFSRRDRSVYYWKSVGKVSLNSVAARIDYNLGVVRLLNSLCGIKVWVNWRKRLKARFVF